MARSGFKTGSVWVQHQGSAPLHHNASQTHSANWQNALTDFWGTQRKCCCNKIWQFKDAVIFTKSPGLWVQEAKYNLGFPALAPELRHCSTCISVHMYIHIYTYTYTHMHAHTESDGRSTLQLHTTDNAKEEMHHLMLKKLWKQKNQSTVLIKNVETEKMSYGAITLGGPGCFAINHFSTVQSAELYLSLFGALLGPLQRHRNQVGWDYETIIVSSGLGTVPIIAIFK